MTGNQHVDWMLDLDAKFAAEDREDAERARLGVTEEAPDIRGYEGFGDSRVTPRDRRA